MEPDASLTSSKTPPSGRKIKSHQMSVVRRFGMVRGEIEWNI